MLMVVFLSPQAGGAGRRQGRAGSLAGRSPGGAEHGIDPRAGRDQLDPGGDELGVLRPDPLTTEQDA